MGDERIGYSSLTAIATDSSTTSKNDTYTDGSDAQTITATGTTTRSWVNYEILGNYQRVTNSSETNSVNETGSRAGMGYSLTSTGQSTSSSDHFGVRHTGAYGLYESSANHTNVNVANGNGTSRQETNHFTSSISRNGNDIQGWYAAVDDATTDRTNVQYSNGNQNSVSTSESSSDHKVYYDSNDLNGVYNYARSHTLTRGLNQTATDGTNTFGNSSTESLAGTEWVSGNQVSGAYTIANSAQTGTYSFSQSQNGAVSLVGSGNTAFVGNGSGNEITGDYRRVDIGSESYQITGYSVDSYSHPVTRVHSGSSSWIHRDESGNTLNGGFTRQIYTSGGYTFSADSIDPWSEEPVNTSGWVSESWNVFQSGNYLTGALSSGISTLANTRYADMPFLNMADGNVEFSPVGAPFHFGTGPEGLTGGGMMPMADASPGEGQRLLGSLTDNHTRSGAANDAALAALGNDLLHEYCFAAGTHVDTKRGMVAIEALRDDDLILCVPDYDPLAALEYRPIVKLYHNAPAELLNVHVGEQLIRATRNHPWYVPGRGWVATAQLRIGDSLRTASGRSATVTDLCANGDIEPVFNLQVAEHHTYFVDDDSGGTCWCITKVPN